MALFDLSNYRLRKLNPQQGIKPLDFGSDGIVGSVNLDGRFVALNMYHSEHGAQTLTSIPPFPDDARYQQEKVRAYRKSLASDNGFGLSFEQEIVDAEHYLIEDSVPFMRLTLADKTIAECITLTASYHGFAQYWRFSSDAVEATITGHIWLQRMAYTQLTEGGVKPMPSNLTTVAETVDNVIVVENKTLRSKLSIIGLTTTPEPKENGLVLQSRVDTSTGTYFFGVFPDAHQFDMSFADTLRLYFQRKPFPLDDKPLVVNRAIEYGMTSVIGRCMVTDHMILPLLWTRDSYYVVKAIREYSRSKIGGAYVNLGRLDWLFRDAWRGTYCTSLHKPISNGWGRAYMANGMPKDNKAFQLDQQIYPYLELAELMHELNDADLAKTYTHDVEQFLRMLGTLLIGSGKLGLYPTDETPADDEIPLHYHFSTHILLWHTLHKLKEVYVPLLQDRLENAKSSFEVLIEYIQVAISKYFITEHNGKQVYAYATDGEGNHYLYHDANDIPLVMMPLWGFCEKDDPIWLNTIEFAFSDANIGFYDGVLGSVHTPAPWALGDAQELIYCKVVGDRDRDRYQRVWERVEKAAQWDGALPEAYDANTFEVVSRHWFAWPNAMIAIADSISWDWETEGEFAK